MEEEFEEMVARLRQGVTEGPGTAAAYICDALTGLIRDLDEGKWQEAGR